MVTRGYFGLGVAAGLLMLASSVAWTQTPSDARTASAGATMITSGSASERQDQLPKASICGKTILNIARNSSDGADANSLDSAHASDSPQIAAMKYEDRGIALSNGHAGKLEQGVGSKQVPVVKPQL